MAPSPWPDYQCSEPKAPDKKSDVYSSRSDQSAKSSGEKKETGADKEASQIEIGQLKPQVTALDEFGLKALLDEALTLRFSEDVEGKSVLLKGLFEEVNSKKPPRTVTTDVPKQSSSSGKPNKKSKVRRSHMVSDQNEISNYAKHKSDSKTSSKSILGPKNVDANESNVSRENLKSSTDVCKIPSNGRLVSDNNKKGKQTVADVQKQMGRIGEIMKSCDMAKIVTIPGGNKNSSEGKNSKNMLRIPPVAEIDKRPKEHFTPNIDKICRKIDQKDIDRVKALSQGPGVKEISIPTAQLNSNKVTGVAVLRSQTENENQTSPDEKKPAEYSDVSKTISSDNDLDGFFSRDISIIRGEDQFAKIKKIDENGNALCSSKIDDSRKGKARRVKVKNDENTVMSQNIEGYRGDIDIEAVIQYIESTDEKQGRKSKQAGISLAVSKQSRISNKIRPIRDKSSEAIGRKGRKSHESKLKKSNSLEEVSTSKLEDLTSSFSKCFVSNCLDSCDIAQTHCEYDSKVKNYNIKTETVAAGSVALKPSTTVKCLELKKDNKSENESAGESEFHIVKKKQRKRKRTTGGNDERRNSKNSGIGRSSFSGRFDDVGRSRRGILKNFGYLEEARGRKPAASVPHSDKSADSSDADSVHSLPVSSSSLTSKSNVTNENSLTSYADIARSVTTPPRGGSTPTLNKPSTSLSNDLTKAHCVSSEEIPCVTLLIPKTKKSVCPSASQDVNIDKDYPPLKKLHDKKANDMFVEFTLQLPKSNKVKGNNVSTEETVLIKRPSENKCIVESTTFSMPLEDSCVKRPPVILMQEKNSHDSSAVNELVFGFEVNQQLLVSGQNDSVVMKEKSNSVTEEETIEIDSYEHNHSKTFNHCDIVDYISREWQLTMDQLKNDKTGKIVYFKP